MATTTTRIDTGQVSRMLAVAVNTFHAWIVLVKGDNSLFGSRALTTSNVCHTYVFSSSSERTALAEFHFSGSAPWRHATLAFLSRWSSCWRHAALRVTPAVARASVHQLATIRSDSNRTERRTFRVGASRSARALPALTGGHPLFARCFCFKLVSHAMLTCRDHTIVSSPRTMLDVILPFLDVQNAAQRLLQRRVITLSLPLTPPRHALRWRRPPSPTPYIMEYIQRDISTIRAPTFRSSGRRAP